MSETYLEKRTCAYCNGERTIKCERCRGRGGRWAYRLRPTSFGYQTMAMRSEWVGDLFQLPRQPPRAMLALPVARSSICWMGKKRDTMRSRCERRRAPLHTVSVADSRGGIRVGEPLQRRGTARTQGRRFNAQAWAVPCLPYVCLIVIVMGT